MTNEAYLFHQRLENSGLYTGEGVRVGRSIGLGGQAFATTRASTMKSRGNFSLRAFANSTFSCVVDEFLHDIRGGHIIYTT